MSLSLQEILQLTGAERVNPVRPGEASPSALRVLRPAPLPGSGPEDLCFFFSREYEDEIPAARPGVLLVSPPFAKGLEKLKPPVWTESVVISTTDPYYAMAILSEEFAKGLSTVGLKPRPQHSEIHASAVIHPTAQIGAKVKIGPHCTIEAGARVGAGSVLMSGCWIGPDATLGEDCLFFPNVVVYEWAAIGHRVRVHANTVIGSDGFGYAPKKTAGRVESLQKIYHLGRVVIEDDVELGAGVTVDRSTFGETRIGTGTKLDNQVHVGHNATIGRWTVIAAATCLGGRAKVGSFVQCGGLTGITNNVHVGDGAQVGALALLTKDVPPGGTAVGNPQREYREHFKVHAKMNRLLDQGEKK